MSCGHAVALRPRGSPVGLRAFELRVPGSKSSQSSLAPVCDLLALRVSFNPLWCVGLRLRAAWTPFLSECMYCKRERVIQDKYTDDHRQDSRGQFGTSSCVPRPYHAIRASLSAHVQDGACGEVAHIGRAVANVCKEQGHAARLDEPRPGHLLVGEHAEGGGHVRLKLGLL